MRMRRLAGHCASTRWPASRCRPAASRWPKPSATCRRSSTRDALLATSTACAMRDPPADRRLSERLLAALPRQIALVGKAPGRYNLMLGADHRGQRLNALTARTSTKAAVLDELDPLFGRYAHRRRMTSQHFGDYLVARARITPPRRRRTLAMEAGPMSPPDPITAAESPQAPVRRTESLAGTLVRTGSAWRAAFDRPGRAACAVHRFRRAVGGVAAPAARRAGPPGDPDRHRVPLPRDLSLRRQTSRAAFS